jgi:hypothetical protein
LKLWQTLKAGPRHLCLDVTAVVEAAVQEKVFAKRTSHAHAIRLAA